MAIRRVNKPIVQREGGDAIFGEGTDGAATFDGTATVISLAPTSNVYKLVKDIYCTNLTVNSGVTLFTNGFRVFVNGTFTNNGTVGMPAAVTHSVADGSGTIAGRQTSLNPSKAWGTSTDPISVTDLYDLDDAVSGFFITGAGVVTKIAGGSLGTAGSNGTTTLPTGPFAGGALFPPVLAHACHRIRPRCARGRHRGARRRHRLRPPFRAQPRRRSGTPASVGGGLRLPGGGDPGAGGGPYESEQYQGATSVDRRGGPPRPGPAGLRLPAQWCGGEG